MRLKRATGLALAAAMVPTFPSFAAQAGHGDEQSAEAVAVQVERRILTKGTHLYERLDLSLPKGQIANHVVFEVHYPAGLDWAGNAAQETKALLDGWASRSSQGEPNMKSNDLDVPEPPDTTPPVGSRHTINVSCVTIRTGPSSSFSANVTFIYEYRYTRDTNGDNKPDADPMWVLVEVKIEPLYTEGMPHLC